MPVFSGWHYGTVPGAPRLRGSALRHYSRFGQLILRKIIKIVATRCRILKLKCTKFDFGWGFAPDPAGGAYSAPADPLLNLSGLLLRGGREREGKGREVTGAEGR